MFPFVVHLHLTMPNSIHINPLPDDKILGRSKLKQIADNILKCI